MEVICTYGIPKVTEEAFIDYFQGCFLTYPYNFFFFSNWLYFYCTWHIWSETFRRWRQRSLKVKLCGKSFSCAEMSHLLLPGTIGKRNIGLSRHKIVLTCIWLEKHLSPLLWRHALAWTSVHQGGVIGLSQLNWVRIFPVQNISAHDVNHAGAE